MEPYVAEMASTTYPLHKLTINLRCIQYKWCYLSFLKCINNEAHARNFMVPKFVMTLHINKISWTINIIFPLGTQTAMAYYDKYQMWYKWTWDKTSWCQNHERSIFLYLLLKLIQERVITKLIIYWNAGRPGKSTLRSLRTTAINNKTKNGMPNRDANTLLLVNAIDPVISESAGTRDHTITGVFDMTSLWVLK